MNNSLLCIKQINKSPTWGNMGNNKRSLGFSKKDKQLRKLDISFVFTMDKINLITTDLNLFIYQKEIENFTVVWGRGKEVIQTKSSELLRKK